MPQQQNNLIPAGALIALAGYALSGPLSVGLSQWLHPQPAWTSAQAFVEHFHPIQNLTYYFGFFLLGGMLMLMAGHYLRAGERSRPALLVALLLSAAFTALVCFNYIVQTTFVSNLARYYRPEFDTAIAVFSMVNPMSLCWGIEMWGYALLGIATWLLAADYRDRNPVIRSLLVLNGWMSVAGALLTARDIAWVLTTGGLIAYTLWNVLMMALMVLIYRDAKREAAV